MRPGILKIFENLDPASKGLFVYVPEIRQETDITVRRVQAVDMERLPITAPDL